VETFAAQGGDHAGQGVGRTSSHLLLPDRTPRGTLRGRYWKQRAQLAQGLHAQDQSLLPVRGADKCCTRGGDRGAPYGHGHRSRARRAPAVDDAPAPRPHGRSAPLPLHRRPGLRGLPARRAAPARAHRGLAEVVRSQAVQVRRRTCGTVHALGTPHQRRFYPGGGHTRAHSRAGGDNRANLTREPAGGQSVRPQ